MQIERMLMLASHLQTNMQKIHSTDLLLLGLGLWLGLGLGLGLPCTDLIFSIHRLPLTDISYQLTQPLELGNSGTGSGDTSKDSAKDSAKEGDFV